MFYKKSKEIERLTIEVDHLRTLVSEWEQLYMKEFRYRHFFISHNLGTFGMK